MGYTTDFWGEFLVTPTMENEEFDQSTEEGRMVAADWCEERGDNETARRLRHGALLPEHVAYLKAFCETRRMRRDPEIAAGLPDPVRIAARLPIGPEGGYFVGSTGHMGPSPQNHATDRATILEYNLPPAGQPGLWCQWKPGQSYDMETREWRDEGKTITWDGGEKFYGYTEWLEYIIEHFLKVWGYALNGSVNWQGEDQEDIGLIEVKGNVIDIKHGRIVYE